jgi:16S rRNA (adenine1518-N6/adenine1519-N6)-dimethyltransferase
LTDLLVQRAGRVVAIELDRDLIQHLRERYANSGNAQIIEADVLDLDLAKAAGQDDFLLAGNVPYYITTPILFHALEAKRPRRSVFLVQREVAERVAAPPGSKTYGALSVNVQAVARPELVARVAASAFRPPPSVESAILRITPRDDPVVSQESESSYRRLVQDAFGLRRKQLRRVVRTIAAVDADTAERILRAAGIDPESRPETLSPNDFARLLAGIESVSGRGS